jgi:hypothetical protein
VTEAEFNAGCTELGLPPGAALADVERAFMKRNFALIKSGTAAEREQLRALFDRMVAHLKDHPPAAPPRAGEAPPPPGAAARPGPVYVPPAPDPSAELLNPLSFDSWLVNALALPAALGLAALLRLTPLSFFMAGFHIWVHELGHATVAWFSGRRALPLPIGWTSVVPQKSIFVFLGMLFLLGVFAVAGWRERKPWPGLLALAALPFLLYLSWAMPEHRTDFWFAFGGIGGEFCLGAAFMAAFYVQLPEKFKWGACRYFFLFLGASSFLNVFLFWRAVRRGTEGIPWGAMVTGEDDAGGDMNILRDDYAWNNHHIIGAYNSLGTWCALALGAVYLVFAFRLDRPVGRLVAAWWPQPE